MPEGPTLIAFVIASMLVLLIPGPGFIYVLARSLGQGRRAGVISAAGLSAGAMVQVLAATAGLSAMLMASATAFGIIKLLGAAYLVYLGLRTLFRRQDRLNTGQTMSGTARRIFLDGIVVNSFNPKIAIFFLAFLPQFVDPAIGSASTQLLILGMIFVSLAFMVDSTLAVLATWLRERLGPQLSFGSLPRYAAATVYIGLGLATALVERRS
ncbi:MAG: LysE family translocator [Minwuia sp.]|nr:LysE family translocator [Minwuia sp.]